MTLVLLHPVGLDAHCWQFMDLPEPTALDLLGHGGRTDRPGTSLAEMADDVAARVAGPIDAVGLSMGGAVGMHLALRHPDRVRSLVLACTSAATRAEVMAERAAAVLADGMVGVTESILARWFTPAAVAAPDHPGVGYARRRLLADRAEDFAAGWRALGGHDVRAELPSIGCPVTVVAGTEDQSSSLDGLRGIAERLPVSRFVALRGPHMLQLEEPAALSALVREHLTWTDATRAAG
ncbi:alpha/beta fold hydrolase [Micromonospora sp. WMMD1082]|uniref:alpha/beta fold hydrolase n=1 Tax=Micromonospora sp. WMMD1082 TaxID=3016104 RepID=UPI00241675C4|nr:alpha/beta fold hydrolase [Micromonospora sp. WMMD1082]MDG4798361.1 alpha/beta fold hydrolase [Micromonospora sp. WMMD1082]